jgi:predicted dienelactone hydrolase
MASRQVEPMRPLEMLLVTGTFVAAVISATYFRRPGPPWLIRLILISGGVLVASQILWEGWRWQMLPAYVAIVPLIFLSSARNPLARSLSIASLLVSVFVSVALGYVFPLFRLPKPRGHYQVGTFARHLIDRRRRERHASSPQASRELMIQVWYPAKNVAGVRAWYRDPRMNTAKSYHLRWVKTHSFWDLPAAEEPREFPVLLFSPSSGGFRSQNTFQVEELASQGYIVVGIDHPYSCSRVVFPDGRIAYSLPWIDTTGHAAYEVSNRKVELMLEDHVADASFVLDEMERWNQPDSTERLAGRMDLTRVGVFGHSFGGALAASLCLAEPRVVAGINMDGWTFGNAEKTGIAKPFFFMNSGNGRGPDRADLNKLSGDARIEGERDLIDWQSMESSLKHFGGYHLTILGSHHGNYSDLVLFKRVPAFRGPRPLDPYLVFEIINAYSLAFFDRYIRNRPAPLLEQAGSRKVRYKAYPVPASASLTSGDPSHPQVRSIMTDGVK